MLGSQRVILSEARKGRKLLPQLMRWGAKSQPGKGLHASLPKASEPGAAMAKTSSQQGRWSRGNLGLLWGAGLGSAAVLAYQNRSIFQGSSTVEGPRATAKVTDLPAFVVDGQKTFDYVVVGGGTAGCVLAYHVASWMEEQGLPGRVLLLERGEGYEQANPAMEGWYENWGSLGMVHESFLEQQSGARTAYPISPSSHLGIGGCGAHDTRIAFMPSQEDRREYAKAFGWSQQKMDTYLQAALNIEPIIRTARSKEAYFDKVLQAWQKQNLLGRLPGDRFMAKVEMDKAAYFDIGAFPDGKKAQRWSSALLVADGLKPKNLTIGRGVHIDRVHFDAKASRALGLVVEEAGEKRYLDLGEHGRVTLAAGALETPAMLQRSGIGDPQALAEKGVALTYANKEVGHGVDHEEVAVQYEPPTRWPGGALPRGGAMGWALGVFQQLDHLERAMQVHFSISGPPYSDGVSVVGTPNNTKPDLKSGFRVELNSTDPKDSLKLVYQDSPEDQRAFLQGVRQMVRLFEGLKQEGLVGERLAPPPGSVAEGGVPLEDDAALWDWIKENKGTAYHWLCTCKAGIASAVQTGTVADESFRVRSGGDRAIENLYVASGASLPFPPLANPHVTIQAFAMATAHQVFQDLADARGWRVKVPSTLRVAERDLQRQKGEPQIRKPGQERPRTDKMAQIYAERHRGH